MREPSAFTPTHKPGPDEEVPVAGRPRCQRHPDGPRYIKKNDGYSRCLTCRREADRKRNAGRIRVRDEN